MVPARFSWDRPQAEQDRGAGAGKCGQGWAAAPPAEVPPQLLCSSRLGALVCPAPP